jgi:hypothetical protein
MDVGCELAHLEHWLFKGPRPEPAESGVEMVDAGECSTMWEKSSGGICLKGEEEEDGEGTLSSACSPRMEEVKSEAEGSGTSSDWNKVVQRDEDAESRGERIETGKEINLP